ncbi:hydroxymethylglutaryl-CoA lyase [Pseudomonas fluorescens]|jgi:hydroxymethylglutaryl-CoA lyase|uniref:hydroxymethylglutaryl-CoA lyase n=1 Tax=Pseudomonas frederiksbergensis TaxID=104087 RepID=A0A0B1Z1C0_9PSED|nr:MULTISPECIES: hydroxymethylglutaryl-CoA lyase [Pseudomonas]KHK63056.1 hydroxymethylglutaryl-CoA lyase [Pseudomonas frederiksbergensis]KJH86590.1 hydroxymethylglutaryl-CoA lyase [Pseudomonas fluorescens]MBI6619337.1 hydroxymethylglutaryl-CoA lyase [Pseudomonas corrugata]MBI6691169.1 hydroxymethylglutaryl-CoA lyase [Pseudomonas corrugata]
MSMDSVRLVEVGARDGLQNEARSLPVETRVLLLERLAAAGLRTIESGAFVSPRWVPQMAGSDEVLRRLTPRPGVTYTALVPNLEGLERALAVGCREVAVFAAASEAFSQRNINCSIAQSLERFQSVLARAREAGVAVRGYVSCVMGCPFTGQVPTARVVEVARALHEMGCYEISLGDTIGTGTPGQTARLIKACVAEVPLTALAAHFHDTYGMAVANVHAALEAGVRVFDSSVSGLGGCPYSPGATGNVASEELVYLFHGLGLSTGIDLARLIEAGAFVDQALHRPTGSRVAKALLHKHNQLEIP